MKWQNVVFDLDDTLFPEKEYILSGFHACAIWMEQNFGVPASQGYQQLQQLFECGARGNTFDQWLSRLQLKSDKLIKQLIQVYRGHSPDIHPFPGTEAMLEEISKCSKLGILSDGFLSVQQRKLTALNIAQYFDCVVFSDLWGRESWKPSSKPYLEVMKQLAAKSGVTVYIGDNPLKDFFGARRCGWQTIWLRREEGEYTRCVPPSSSFAPDIIVSSVLELMNYLGEGPNR